ncbi:uncharacterized protein LOC133735867 [Rosa rugosa]|uniref:uncharacterized protein LOC133735867 n=1 Tax=Rosa rugosa TaxID=74645 RepID=UPI002B407800|nr:uncharacterized protein LOC133735867 [Rosa rugosa]
MANRLKTFLPEIISSTKSAFFHGRNIQDNVIATFETVYTIQVQKSTPDPKLVLKLDISKAYDRVEWTFLEEVMKKLGFVDVWINLVMRCVKSVSSSIFWKGQPVGMFRPTRGIHQGDPLSSYLFLLVSEGVSGLLHRADEVGQRINFQKSVLSFGPNVSNKRKAEIQEIFNLPMVDFHEKYLGLPTTIGKNKKDVSRKMNERLDFHLQGSKGSSSQKRSKVSQFWWGKGGGARGIHWCSWEMLCGRKEDGGLGFRDLRPFNRAMLAKTVWRIFWSKGSLVNDILQAKYFPNTCFLNASLGTTPSTIWRGLLWGKQVIDSGSRWRIGDGQRVSIKEDRWLPCPTTFKVVSPIPISTEWKVESLLTEIEVWNVPLIHSLFLTHEAEMILSLPMARELSAKKGGVVAGSSSSNVSTIWKKVWGLKVPHKIKLLLWRAMHNYLPCGQIFQKRNIVNEASCRQCGAHVESAIHVFWECPKAKRVWKLSFLSEVCKTWKEPSVMDLFSYVCSIAVGSDLENSGYVVWWLWRNRNLHRHEEKFLKPEELIAAIGEWQTQYEATNAKIMHSNLTGSETVRSTTIPHLNSLVWSPLARTA